MNPPTIKSHGGTLPTTVFYAYSKQCFSRGKGKAKRVAATSADTKADGRRKRGRAGPEAEGGSCTGREGVGAAAVRVKTEPGGEGSGGAFAVPAGTQEVSGEDLSLLVDGGAGGGGCDRGGSRRRTGAEGGGREDAENISKVKKELGESTSQGSMARKGTTSQRSRRQPPPSPPLWQRTLGGSDSDSNHEDAEDKARGGGGGGGMRGGVDGVGGTRRTPLDEALKHIGGDSSGSDGDGTGRGGGRGGGGETSGFGLESSPRRRRKRKKIPPTAAAAVAGGGSGGGSYGASTRPAAAGSIAGNAVKRETGNTQEKYSEPKNILSKMFDDDSDIDDLQ